MRKIVLVFGRVFGVVGFEAEVSSLLCKEFSVAHRQREYSVGVSDVLPSLMRF